MCTRAPARCRSAESPVLLGPEPKPHTHPPARCRSAESAILLGPDPEPRRSVEPRSLLVLGSVASIRSSPLCSLVAAWCSASDAAATAGLGWVWRLTSLCGSTSDFLSVVDLEIQNS